MYRDIFDFLCQIPTTLSNFGNWLITPIAEPYISLSPLALLGIAGVGVVISLIVIHVIRLFVP